MPEITKRRVVLRHGPTTHTGGGELVDYVRPDPLEAYLAHHEAQGWEIVDPGFEVDAGPGGYDGDTYEYYPTLIPEL